jgi:hypothetical protein
LPFLPLLESLLLLLLLLHSCVLLGTEREDKGK